MNVNLEPLNEYVTKAPLALALERIYEVSLMRQQTWQHPILDIGCGDGIFAQVAFKQPIDYGLDPDAVELSRAASTRRYSSLLAESASNMSLEDESIQTAFSNSVLEHIENLDPVLKEIWRVLRPGGRLYVTVPSDRFEKYSITASLLSVIGLQRQAERFSRFYNSFWRHYHCYSETEWKEKFLNAGFTVRASTSYISPGRCRIHDLLVPLALPSFVSRKFNQRWFFAPALRRAVTPMLVPIASKLVDKKIEHPDGGLLYFELEKSGTKGLDA